MSKLYNSQKLLFQLLAIIKGENDLGKVEDKKKQKKEALLVSAMQLYTEKGIEDTSVLEITRNAKMAKGTFYLYFKDKYAVQDCLIAREANRIFERAQETMGDILENMAPETVEDGIIYLVENIVDQFTEEPEILRFISKNLSWGIFSNIRITDLNNRNCMDLFDSILEKSDKTYRQKELMIYMIVELVNATCYNVILNQAPVTVEKLKKDLFLAVRGILRQFTCEAE